MSFYYQKKHGHCGDMKKDEVKCEIELKKECKKDKKGKMAVDFQSFVLDPNVFSENETLIPLAATTETVIATITFKDVQKYSEILLQALAHVSGEEGTVIVRIRRFDNGSPIVVGLGDLIYETDELTIAAYDQVAALHVDKEFMKCEEKVTYALTLEASVAGGYARPLTFAGTEFN